MDVDIQDRLTQLKLRLLAEKLEIHKQRIGNNKYQSIVEKDRREDVTTFQDNKRSSKSQMMDLKLQLEEAKREQVILRQQLESQKYYQERPVSNSLSTQSGSSMTDYKNQSSVRRTDDPNPSRGIDPIQSMMQMMLMQQQQMQSMVMNQMMLKNIAPQQPAAAAAPIIIPSSQPQIAVPPYPIHSYYMNDRYQNPNVDGEKKYDKAPNRVQLRKLDFPFPGNSGQQRLRRLTYAALFCVSLYRLAREIMNKPVSEYDAGYQVNEVISILHRIYLSPNGHVYPILLSSIIGYESNEFQSLLDVSLNKESKTELGQMLGEIIEGITIEICNIMPINGILGTNPNSGIFKMIMTSQKFPSDFFLDIEKLVLVLDENNSLAEASDDSAVLLLAGVFFMKALVKTLFIQPMFYGFIPHPGPHPAAQRNLQMLSSLFTLIFRQLIANLINNKQASSKKKTTVAALPGIPKEIETEIIPDQTLQPVVQLCQKNLDNCETMIVEWAREYFSRLIKVKS